MVCPQTLDKEITGLHLSDTSIYRETSEKVFHSQCRKLNALWVSVAKSAGLDRRFIARLALTTPICPVLYSLIKTHKLSEEGKRSLDAATYKIWPTISCVDGPTDPISWFLNKIVGQLLNFVPSHLENTEKLLDRSRSCRFPQHCVIESIDVTALYTNVDNVAALQALSEMLDEHESSGVTFGLRKSHMILVKECLCCNIFKWSGKFFSQHNLEDLP